MGRFPKLLTGLFRDFRNSYNEGIDKAEIDLDKALSDSGNALTKATSAETISANVQEQLNQIVIEGDSSVEAAQARVKADGTSFTTLRSRLNDTDEQLAEKATKAEVNTKVAAVASGSPKGTYATLSSLQSAFPTGNTNIYVVSADGKWYYWNGSAWTAGGTYQSTGIAKGSITAEETEFLTKSPNLFNKITITQNKYVDPSNGLLIDSANNDASDFIEIEPSTTYVKNVKGHVVFYNSSQVLISGLNDSTAIAGYAFQTPANAKYVRFSIKKSEGYSAETAQFEKNSTPTAYSPFGVSFVKHNVLDLLKGKKVKPTEIEYMIKSRNLFNKTTRTVDYFLDYATGNLVANTGSDTSDYIEIEPSTAYVKNVKGHVAFYTSARTYISGIAEVVAVAGYSFTTPANAKYMRFSIKKGEGFSPDSTQLEKGVSTTLFVPFDSFSFGSTIDISNSFTQALIDYLQQGYVQRKYKGKKMNFLGDSITENGTYQSTLKATLGLSVTRNYGVGGTTLVGNGTNGFVDRYSTMDNDADIVYVQGGTNDFGQNIPIATFKSQLRVLIEGLLQKYVGKVIVFGTLPPRYLTYLGANTAGHTTLDYANATKELCAEYSIPVVDLHNESGINRFNMDIFMPDKVHPSSAGYAKLTNLIISKMNQL